MSARTKSEGKLSSKILCQVGEEVGSVGVQRRRQVVLVGFLVGLLIVVDAVEVLEVFDVPEADVVVVGAAGDELSVVADVHGFNRQRVLSDDAQNAPGNQMHGSDDAFFAGGDGDALGDWDHHGDGRGWT